MDENKINPIPENEPQNQQEMPVEENSVVGETEIPENNESVASEETVVAEETADDLIVNNESEAEETDVDEFQEEPEPEFVEAVPAPKKKKSKGAVALLVILVALLLTATVFFVSVIMKSTASSRIDHDEIAVTVGDDKITVGEYLYWYAYVDAYYYNYYSYYYSQIPEDQIKADTLNQLAHTTALYNKAVAAGYELSDEDKAQIDENMQGYTQAAETASVSVDDYVAKNFGKGYTLEMLRTYLEKQAVAYNYYEDIMNKIEDDFNASDVEDKVEKAYNANKGTYDLANVSYCYFDATDESAEKNANSVIAKMKDGMSFADAVKAVKGDDESVSDSLVGLSKDAISANFNEDASKWIFEVDADGIYVNGTGAATTLETGGVIYVLYVNDVPARNSFIPVSLDYIQVKVTEEDTIKSETELALQSKAKATELLAEFEKTDKTAEAFTAFAQDVSADVNGPVKTATEENIVADGTRDAAVENWMSEDGRKAGDYAFIEGEDGAYYIVYMTNVSEKPVWYQSVFNSLLEAELKAWEDEFVASYEDNIVSEDEVINNAVAAFKQNMTQSAE